MSAIDKMDGSMWVSMWYTSTTDVSVLMSELEVVLKNSTFSILGEEEYHFDPQGFTKLFLLAESHLAIHTWPEKDVAWIELASCIEDKYHIFVETIKKAKLENLREVTQIVSRP